MSLGSLLPPPRRGSNLVVVRQPARRGATISMAPLPAGQVGTRVSPTALGRARSRAAGGGPLSPLLRLSQLRPSAHLADDFCVADVDVTSKAIALYGANPPVRPALRLFYFDDEANQSSRNIPNRANKRPPTLAGKIGNTQSSTAVSKCKCLPLAKPRLRRFRGE
eukprot:GHVT01077886.1.p2 GENE.GHVT01077886.1~~GHVT01077886.1.p2  ORF type:complete len:165 (-),score=35.59 GHVT01077886.1:20-514(-)